MAANQNQAQLLTEQLRLLQEFLQITTAQTALIEGENMDALNENLELRAQLIEKIERLRPQLTAQKSGATDRPVMGLQEQISRILQEISEINDNNQAAMRERMDFLQAEMRRTGDTRKGLSAYIKGAEVFDAEYFDERK